MFAAFFVVLWQRLDNRRWNERLKPAAGAGAIGPDIELADLSGCAA